jgi:hypothetical protein
MQETGDVVGEHTVKNGPGTPLLLQDAGSPCADYLAHLLRLCCRVDCIARRTRRDWLEHEIEPYVHRRISRAQLLTAGALWAGFGSFVSPGPPACMPR